MKKLVLMAAAIVAVSFASCGGNKAADEKAAADSARIADSIEAAQAAAAAEAEEAAKACCGDSLKCDSLKAAAAAAESAGE